MNERASAMDELVTIFQSRGLSKLEARVCAAIAVAAGQKNSDGLISLVWEDPDNEPEWPSELIGTVIWRIRSKASITGIDIPKRDEGKSRTQGFTLIIRSKPKPMQSELRQVSMSAALARPYRRAA